MCPFIVFGGVRMNLDQLSEVCAVLEADPSLVERVGRKLVAELRQRRPSIPGMIKRLIQFRDWTDSGIDRFDLYGAPVRLNTPNGGCWLVPEGWAEELVPPCPRFTLRGLALVSEALRRGLEA